MADTHRIVFAYLPGQTDAVPAGRLVMHEDAADTIASTFTYGRRYVERHDAIAVDPFSLPIRAGSGGTPVAPQNGLPLFGALRDATPDAWGRRVIENRLHAAPNSLPEPVYLDHAGPHRAGALDVRMEPDSPPSTGALPQMVELTHLLQAADRIAEGQRVPAHLEAIFVGGPTLGGARPKAVIEDDATQWIAKFPSRDDPFDVPTIERATMELARSAGITVPRTRAITLADGRRIMLVERFDRVGAGPRVSRRHMVTALTMMGLHERESPHSSYAGIARAIEAHGAVGTVSADRCELFRRMVFNILVSNDDDHLRNHAFLHDGAGGWRLSPLYDVVPRPSHAAERYLHLAVGPRGRLATLDNALAAAGQFGLTTPDAAAVIESVVAAVRPWRELFDALDVPASESDRVETAFRRARDIGLSAVERASAGSARESGVGAIKRG